MNLDDVERPWGGTILTVNAVVADIVVVVAVTVGVGSVPAVAVYVIPDVIDATDDESDPVT